MRQVRVAVAVQIYLSKKAEGISVMRPVHDGTMRRLITRRTTPCKNAWIQVDGCPEVSDAACSRGNHMPTQAKLVEQPKILKSGRQYSAGMRTRKLKRSDQHSKRYPPLACAHPRGVGAAPAQQTGSETCTRFARMTPCPNRMLHFLLFFASYL